MTAHDALNLVAEVKAGYERGWHFIRLVNRTKRPYDSGFGKGVREAPVSREEVLAWAAQGNNVAVLTGPISNLLVIDVDVEKDDAGNPVEDTDVAEARAGARPHADGHRRHRHRRLAVLLRVPRGP